MDFSDKIKGLMKEFAELRRKTDELKKYKALCDKAPDLVYLCDTKGNILYVNDTFEDLTGFKPEEFTGRPFTPLFDEKNLKIANDAYARTLKGENTVCELTFKDTGKVCELKSFSFKDTGNIAGIIGMGREITQRKLVEEALRASEEKYQRMFEECPLGICCFGADGIIIRCNESFLRILETGRENVIGLDLPAVLKNGKVKEAVTACLSGKKGYFEGDYSKELSLKANFGPVFAKDGAILSCIGIIEDVTGQKKAQEMLLKSKESLAEAQRISHIGNWDWNVKEDELCFSDEIYRILGLNPAAFSPTFDEFIGRVHPDDRALLKKVIDAALSHGSSPPIDYRIIKPDGTVRMVNGRREAWFDESGHPVKIKGIIQDVTEQRLTEEALKESEERFRQMAETIKEVFWLTDKDSNALYISQAYEDIWGRTRESLYSSPESWADAIHPEDREKVLKAYYERQGEEYEGVFRITRPDGTIRWIRIREFPVKDGSGNAYRKAGIAEDITEIKKMEEELIRAEKLDSLGVLAGGIAHNFNNILTAILGNISLSKMRVDTKDKQYRWLTDAEKAVFRAMELANQMLTFSKGGAPVKETVSIAPLVRESADFAVSGSNVRCEYYIPEDLWPAEADRSQISQVMHNLIINAVQAMPLGGTIKIFCKNIEKDGKDKRLAPGKYLKISILDHGVGVPEENLKRIFDPYFTTKEKGSGLGLATVYSIIKNHGGNVKVESRAGSGTVFHVYLPASVKEALQKAEVTETALTPGKGRVLVMDDEEDIRNLAEAVLTGLGYEVRTVRDGNEALDVYREAMGSPRPFDLVIMDLTVPDGMGGKETIKTLLELDPGVKAIVSSGYHNDPIMSGFRDFGFKGALPKPYGAARLSEAVNKVITSE